MSHSPSEVVRQALIDLNLGTLPTANSSWPIVVGQEPNAPDACITVYDPEGELDGRNMLTGEMVEHPGIQVRIRHATHTGGYTRAVLIRDALDTQMTRLPVTVDGLQYIIYAVTRKGTINTLGKSPRSDLRLFTINATLSMDSI